MSRPRKARPSIAIQPTRLSGTSVAKVGTPASQVFSPGSARPGTQAFSYANSWVPQEEGRPLMDPDDVFVKHTVPEVKAIRAKLRADADAKQEELRLMVGERYRDLLQASTSIISIAESAHNVRGSLTAMKALCSANVEEETIFEQRRAGHARRYSTVDVQLPVLHAFSAHLKLLLDAPEHLWRLLERKKYLHAAWLYLLARVVYRALVRKDAGDEGEPPQWAKLGIDVLEQFPLMQRQWDSVSHFRSQISHRATQSLREVEHTPEEVCETLITILLLDTMPLPDILALLLSQRGKALSVRLAQVDLSADVLASEIAAPGLGITPKNTEVKVNLRPADIVQMVKDATNASLSLISGTLGTLRQVFGLEAGRTRSLIEDLMERIQLVDNADDIPQSPVHDPSRRMSLLSPLPRTDAPQLVPRPPVTTALMLRSFPSAQLLLRFLPPAIQSFSPYIDTAAPSNHVPANVLREKTRDWFNSCVTTLENHTRQWMTVLNGIKEIWDVRQTVLERIAGEATFREEERRGLRGWIDRTSKGRAKEVWQERLRGVERTVDEELRKATQLIREGAQDSLGDVQPLDFFFTANLALPSAPPLSSINPASSTIALASFRKYHVSLQQRASGRTPLVQSVLSVLESKAEEQRRDLQTLQGAGEPDELARLLDEYLPAASATCKRLADRVRDLLGDSGGTPGESDLDDASLNAITFAGRLAFILSNSSSVLSDLAFGRESEQDFPESRLEFEEVYRSSLDIWRRHSVRKALREFGTLSNDHRGGQPSVSSEVLPTQPSPSLVRSLLSLKESVCQLGIANTQRGHDDVIFSTLFDYQRAVSDALGQLDAIDRSVAGQALWDLSFLLALTNRDDSIKIPPEMNKTATGSLSSLVAQLCEQVAWASEQTPEDVQARVSASVAQQRQRMQVLFAPLLDAPKQKKAEWKPTALLGWGTPTVEGDVQNPLNVVKPSPRFGLLLVGSTAPLK